MNAPEDLPEVVNDFDIEEEEIAIENRCQRFWYSFVQGSSRVTQLCDFSFLCLKRRTQRDVLDLFFREEYLAKIERRVKEYKIEILSEPRPGKKLLVLDIDYTLFGENFCSSSNTKGSEHAHEMPQIQALGSSHVLLSFILCFPKSSMLSRELGVIPNARRNRTLFSPFCLICPLC